MKFFPATARAVNDRLPLSLWVGPEVGRPFPSRPHRDDFDPSWSEPDNEFVHPGDRATSKSTPTARMSNRQPLQGQRVLD